MATDQAYRFWTHGVNLVVQDEPNRADSVRRNAQGARVRQNSGSNWFHFGITTPSELDGNPVKANHVFLQGHINGHATLQSVHIYEGGYEDGVSIGDKALLKRDNLRFENRSLRDLNDLHLPERNISHEPVLICMNVEFQEGGEVFFAGAGIRFYEMR